jgi:steroid delta-isomerase-like uncharacterized protein
VSEENRRAAVRWMEEVWNQRRDETIDELLAPGAVGHREGVETHGAEEFCAVRATLLGAFPDLRITVEDTVAEGDHVVVRWGVTGTHRGDHLGIAATAQAVEFRGLTWMRFSHGKLVEGWDAWNQGALLEQLRVAPAE